MDDQGLSNVLYALARLEARPPAPWLAAWLDAAAARLPRMASQSLANSMWALARLDARPDAKWLQRFWDTTRPTLARTKPQARAAVDSLQGSEAKVCPG
jgi:hypothetical protein